IEKGDLVLLDFGCRVEGYCSDLTRTVVIGPASNEHHERYDLVLVAQRAGIEALRTGAPASEVDAAARSVLDTHDIGRSFGHGLGHGVGLDIHEAPRLNRDSSDTLVDGDVVTIEPGIYDIGWGGIRTEDCATVTSAGVEVLGAAPKDRLIEL
ncbi:MAG: M24 family metallopeptidase, partial [Actinomycetota bacterium]